MLYDRDHIAECCPDHTYADSGILSPNTAYREIVRYLKGKSSFNYFGQTRRI